jgi:ParB-like chromosome segregation protein Spo0J
MEMMTIIEVPLNQIEVGKRRRQNYGDIAALAKGIERVGLLEPIVVDRNGQQNSYRLIAGERRLKAVRMLKWKSIAEGAA